MKPQDLASWRDRYRSLQTGPSDRCPEDDRLAALTVGEIEGAEREELGDHVVSCRPCSDRFRDLAQLHEAASSDASKRRSRMAWGAVAAVTLVALVTVVAVRQVDTPQGVPEGLRGGATVGAPIEPADRAALTAPPAGISWQPIEDAESYQLLLFDRAGGALWQSEVIETTSVELPGEVRARIEPPGPYLWRIRYVVRLERLETDLRRFTIEP